VNEKEQMEKGLEEEEEKKMENYWSSPHKKLFLQDRDLNPRASFTYIGRYVDSEGGDHFMDKNLWDFFMKKIYNVKVAASYHLRSYYFLSLESLHPIPKWNSISRPKRHRPLCRGVKLIFIIITILYLKQ
jgi:hypothetical protein